ncbi:baseplate J/gp47 family protein [Trabulsiella odontotermitis]|uniref:Tail protein n=1 Tax=Trabulsiella odontotermitis TaxID=379893 RepID=A0A0L0GQS0_9ENTR|nr:baseplate J/gp47 family protein [Trabulsiella odontotermitis]KNC91096.1 tail protein [Trabulsiella odontotermitis]
MPLIIPSQEQLLDQYLEVLKNQQPDADTADDSDHVIRGNATSDMVGGLYQYMAWVLRQMFPDTADDDYLLIHAAQRGLYPKQPTPAGGSATLSGTPGLAFSAGLTFRVMGNDTLYQTTDDGALDGDGKATVGARATSSGTAGNIADASSVSAVLTSPPSGMDSAVQLVSMSGGTDKETPAALLDRLLDVMRQPPAGGNAHDYKVWAMSVDGVGGAWVDPLRRGLGTVDVLITGTDGPPSPDTVSAVQAYIDSVRPVTAKDCHVLAPADRSVDLSIAVDFSSDTTLDAVTADVKTAVSLYFNALLPGQIAVRSQLGALISEVPGVADYDILIPAANVIPEVDATTVEWLRAGDTNVSKMAT